MKLAKSILKYFLVISIFFISLSSILRPIEVSAEADVAGLALAIQTRDGGDIWANLANTAKNIAIAAKKHAYELYKWARDEGIALAYKKALSYFMKQLAYDTATYLATGDKGQGSMFYTENWGDYLNNAADNAAGMFLEELGANGPVAFDLCNPGLDVTAKIGLGIMRSENPTKPDCTFTEMKNNWQAELQRDDFLNRFGNMFEPTSNDFGIALSLQAKIMKKKVEEKEVATFNRTINSGLKDVTEDISKAIKTPGTIVGAYVSNTIADSNRKDFTYTGHLLADTVDTFTSTLLGKLMKEWLKKGISRSRDDSSYSGNWGGFAGGGSSYSGAYSNSPSRLHSSSGSGSFSVSSSGSASGPSSAPNTGSNYSGGGLSAYNTDVSAGKSIGRAREQFQSIIEPNFSVKGDFDVLNKLVACSNPVNAKTDECVMSDNFRQAVENKMTVAIAMNENYLNRDGVFGFRADGLEPNFNEGISYRSMIIMRKYRIIPVGWEIAAQYIKDNQADIGRSLSLYDLIACFDPDNDSEDRYHGYQGYGVPGQAADYSWCEGLVDPSWVLKAPQNFCKREGAGPYIQSSNVFGEGDDSKLKISRDTSYCADEQTCIREDDDGKCEIYGYCLEDRRKYNFGGESCNPQYNTCQSFRAEDGRTVSLLKNTLDYGTANIPCTADNAGCRHYVQAVDPLNHTYHSDDMKVLWDNVNGEINLDYSAKECEVDAEGCHEFIRTKAGLGTNLLTNPSFEEYDGTEFSAWGNIGSSVSDSRDGFLAVQLNSDSITRNISIDPYDISGVASTNKLNGDILTLSLYVKNCTGGTIDMDGTSVSLDATDWKFVSLTHTYNGGDTVHIQINNANRCIIDTAKLEMTTPDDKGIPTRFTNYREAGLVYEKLIPDYLYDSCYDDDIDGDGFIESLPDAPLVCDDYARYCTAVEVNCELYKSITDGFSVPAVATAEDYCPKECVGYDAYLQSATSFEDIENEYFIPSTAKSCGALAAGCDEFTNLDEADDPEAREYFIHMRRCVNPDSVNTCQPFFMWEGSDETGYQLIVHQLNTIGGGGLEVIGASSGCSTDITNPLYDADCRDFYDANGVVHSELFYNTVSCTDDCHPYRRTIMGADLAEETAACNYGGGVMNGASCIYMAVPSEGITCQAEEAGCREYNGNTGANTRIIFEHTFENGTSQGWSGGTVSNASVIVGEHSLGFVNNISLTLGGELMENRSYILQFLATGNITNISFSNGADTEDFDIGGGIDSGGSWEAYKVNLDKLGHTIDPANEILTITGNANIDNIRLIEVTDRYYLIEDSWDDACDHEEADLSLALIPEETFAGCDAYSDRDENVHNLYQFNHLCSESAVGCELMIDTHNYSDYREGIWFDLNGNGTDDGVAEPDFTSVPADSYIYAVYDNDKVCNQQDKGCERMGLEYRYEYPPDRLDYYQYFDNYKLNNPDIYTESLCQTDAVLCDAWKSRKGESYFKDPLDMTCERRIEGGLGLDRWSWLKKKVKRCDVNGNGEIDLDLLSGDRPIDDELGLCGDSFNCDLANATMIVPDWCESDTDCIDTSVVPQRSATCVDNKCRYSCVLDENDYYCEIDNQYPDYPPKTFGYGGPGNKINQPLGDMEVDISGNAINWSAVCPASEDDCTEYIDPESTFSFEVDNLKPYTLYVAGASPIPDCVNGNFYILNNGSNRLEAVTYNNINEGNIFYYIPTNIGNGECDVRDLGIREAVVAYQLEHTLDKSACNGMVDLEQGCLLFNERSREGVDGIASLGYNSDPSSYSIPIAPQTSPAPLETNTLLKIEPDRTCNTWLSCKSFIKDADNNDVCYDVGLCKHLDDNGNCSYFANSVAIGTAHNQVYNGANHVSISNVTGYSKVGYDTSNSLNADYYPLGDMHQVGQVANVPNGNFELFDNNAYPLGWTVPADDHSHANWERDMFKVINNPVAAQTEGIDYPLSGKAFLKLGARDSVQSESIDLVNGVEYMLTFYVNTKNLARGTAEIDASGLGTALAGSSMIFSVPISEDWSMHLIHFTANNSHDRRIVLRTSANSDGNVFVDKIEIKPSLNSRYNTSDSNQWYISPTCRVYPKNDSLACDYYEESSNRVKGLLGYCLEYDRYPGNPDACLMWYPVDRINGDGVEEGGGYIDRKPLYYCVGTASYHYGVNLVPENEEGPTETETLVTDNNFGAQSSGDMSITHRNSDGWSEDDWTLDQLGLGNVDKRWLLWENIDHISIHEMSPSTYCGDKYEPGWDFYFNFDQRHSGNDCVERNPQKDCQPWGVTCTDTSAGCEPGGLRILSTTTDEGESFSGLHTTNWDKECNHPDYQILEVVIFPNVYYCSDVIQTVTPMGQNQYYSANVYEGSNFGQNDELPCNVGPVETISFAETQYCTYMSDLAPFGAVSQPGLEIKDWAIMSNPYMWDSKENIEGNQPLFFEIPNGSMFNDSQARMGQGWDEGTIHDNLFAKDYGRWHFDPTGVDGIRQVVGHYSWNRGASAGGGGAPPTVGDGAPPTDYTLPPGSSNIWTIPNDVYVNQLVNLRFTSDVQPQQLPLTMYMVDWGDDSVTSVAGIEMRDRPSADDPHSLYHIYGSSGSYTITITIRDNWGNPGTGTLNITVLD